MLCTVDAAFVCSVLPADAASLLPSAPLSCDGDGRRGRSISRGRGLGQNVLRLRPRSTDLQQMQDGTGRCFPPPPLPLPLRPLLLRLCVRVCLCVWYGAKLEPAVHRSLLQEKQQHQQFPHHLEQQWSGGNERQPPPWTDELAEMSRHIYTRHGIGEGLQKTAVFQVEQMNAPLFIYFVSCSLSPHLWFSHLFFFFSFFISTSSLKLVCPYFTPPSLHLRHFSPTPSPLSYLPLVFPSSISSSFFSSSFLLLSSPLSFPSSFFSIFLYLIISQLSSALSLSVSSVFLFPHLSTYPLLPSSSSSSAFHLLPFLPLPSSQHISVEVTEFLSSPPSLSLSLSSVRCPIIRANDPVELFPSSLTPTQFLRVRFI